MVEKSPSGGGDRDDRYDSSDEIARFVQRLGESLDTPVVHERRAEHRHRVAIPIVAQPVDDQGEPTGDAFRVIARDISSRGIGLLHNQAVESKFLALEMCLPGKPEDQKIRTVMQVLRCRPIGETMYDIGGPFVMKLTPSADRSGGACPIHRSPR